MSEEINHDRRRFVGTVTMTIAAAQVGMIGSATAQTTKADLARVTTIKPRTNTSFGALKQINAGVLNVGYAEAGPANVGRRRWTRLKMRGGASTENRCDVF